jgi:DNA invertase Pin-like site-specific DNA recombinase
LLNLGLTTKKTIKIFHELKYKGIEFISINEEIDSLKENGKDLYDFLSRLYDLDQEILHNKRRIGLKSKEKRGLSGGRPKKNPLDVLKAIDMYNKKYKIKDITKETGISKATLYCIKDLKG